MFSKSISTESDLNIRKCNKPVVKLNNPIYEINKESFFPYSPTYLMKKSDCRNIKNKRTSREKLLNNNETNTFYQNYLDNAEEIFNKEEYLKNIKKRQERTCHKPIKNLIEERKQSKGLFLKFGIINY